MAHRHDVYKLFNSIDHEIKYKGKYGRKGEKRAPRKKATPEQMQKQNQRNREKNIWRKMRANFFPGDLFVTLKFFKGTSLTKEEVLSIRDDFFNKLRRVYRKIKQPLKFMYRIERGELGGIHFHIVVNRTDISPGTAMIIQGIWKKYGYVNFTPLYEEGNLKGLAEYIVKPAKETKEGITGQLTLFGEEEECQLFSIYNCSRNLIVPEPETHSYSRYTVKDLIEEGPRPTQGYYIDRNSIVSGINPYTGMSYIYYTEVRLKPLTREQIERGDSG